MKYINKFLGSWWNQFKKAGCIGKILLIFGTLMLLSVSCSVILAPFIDTDTTEVEPDDSVGQLLSEQTAEDVSTDEPEEETNDEPTRTRRPTRTPRPTDTDEPEPTETDEPTRTRRPTRTPRSTSTPEPTEPVGEESFDDYRDYLFEYVDGVVSADGGDELILVDVEDTDETELTVFMVVRQLQNAQFDYETLNVNVLDGSFSGTTYEYSRDTVESIRAIHINSVMSKADEVYEPEEPATNTPIPEPTATPFDTEANCTYDKFNCIDFSPISLAQGMFDACRDAGYEDPHKLDLNNNNQACEQPDEEAEQNYYNPATPTPAQSQIPQVCQWDQFKCENFNSQWEAQQQYNQCTQAGQGDIHKLDQDNNGQACDAYFNSNNNTWTPTEPPQNVGGTCDCSHDAYNCPSFPLPDGTTARQCFDYCNSVNAGDIHRLDGDGDGKFCEG